MSGKSHPGTISKAFPVSSVALEVILLALLGAIAVVLRTKLRVPLQIPGHHGMEVMAVILIGRKISALPVASTISTLTAALMMWMPFMGMRDPFLPVVYILMGVTIDLLFGTLKKFTPNFFFFSLLGGIAYMMIPLSRIVLQISGLYVYPSLVREGFLYPVLSHFLFGAIGAFLAASIVYAGEKLKK